MIVEFIGLPGSGKTTIAKNVYFQKSIALRKIRYPLFFLYRKSWFKRNIIKSFKVTKYVLCNYFKSISILKSIYDTNQNSIIQIIRLYFNFMFLLATYGEFKECDDVIIFDEGLLHFMWAIQYASENQLDSINIRQFMDYGIQPDVVVKIDCDANTVFERLILRGPKTRLDKEVNLLCKIKESIDKFDYILSNLKSLKLDSRIDIVSIDNTDNNGFVAKTNIITESIEKRMLCK